MIWELAIKPARVRRNLGLLLIAELELNLEEIAYYRVCREEDPENQLVNMLLPRASFLASQASLGELSARDLRELIRFHAVTSKIEATHVALETLTASTRNPIDSQDMAMLKEAIASGVAMLGRLLEDAWTVGNTARTSLDRTIRDSWMDEPAPLEPSETIVAAARERRAHHRST